MIFEKIYNFRKRDRLINLEFISWIQSQPTTHMQLRCAAPTYTRAYFFVPPAPAPTPSCRLSHRTRTRTRTPRIYSGRTRTRTRSPHIFLDRTRTRTRTQLVFLNRTRTRTRTQNRTPRYRTLAPKTAAARVGMILCTRQNMVVLLKYFRRKVN